MNKNLNIEDNAKILKLSYIKKNYKQLINEAQATEMSYDNFLSLGHTPFFSRNRIIEKIKP